MSILNFGAIFWRFFLLFRFLRLQSLAAFSFPARAAREACCRHAHEVLGRLAAGEASAQPEVDASLSAEKVIEYKNHRHNLEM